MRPFALPASAALLAAALLTGCVQTPAETARQAQDVAAQQADLQKALAGLVPGDTQSCLSNFQSTNLKAYGKTLIYRVSDGLKYRNDTAGGCENVARGDILVTISNGGQLCQGDIARTVQPVANITTGGCALGAFVKYSKP